MNSFCNTVTPSISTINPTNVNGFGYGYGNAGMASPALGTVTPSIVPGILPNATTLNGCSIPGPAGFTQPGLLPINPMNTINTPYLQNVIPQFNQFNPQYLPFNNVRGFNTASMPWNIGGVTTPWNAYGIQSQLPVINGLSLQQIVALPHWQQNIQQLVNVIAQPIWNNLTTCLPQLTAQPQIAQQLYTQLCGTIYNCCCTPAFIGWCVCTLGLSGGAVQNPQSIASIVTLPQWQQIVPQIVSCFFQPILNTVVACIPQVITTPTLFQQVSTQLYTTLASCCCTPVFVTCCVNCGQCCQFAGQYSAQNFSQNLGFQNVAPFSAQPYGLLNSQYNLNPCGMLPGYSTFNSFGVTQPWLGMNTVLPTSPWTNPLLGYSPINTLPFAYPQNIFPGSIYPSTFNSLSNFGYNTPGFLNPSLLTPGFSNYGLFNTLNAQLPFNPLFAQNTYGQVPFNQIPINQIPFNQVPFNQFPGYTGNVIPQSVNPFAIPTTVGVGENGDAGIHMRNAV